MAYTVCVRREVGMCGISWRESDTTSPDPFDLDADLTAGVGVRKLGLHPGKYTQAKNKSFHLKSI